MATPSQSSSSSSSTLTTGSTAKFPYQLLLAPEFLICAGSILFRLPTSADPSLQVCLIKHLRKMEYLLAKGRKDQLEGALLDVAIRETYEETGYPCRPLPVTITTRATLPGEDIKDSKFGTPTLNCVEPFAMTIRHISADNVKLIYWFITEVIGEHEEGTLMPSEVYFESCWFEADEAVETLTYEHDRDVVRKAVELVRAELAHRSLES